MKAAVLGAGAFGTALGVHLDRLGHDVRIWTRDPEKVTELSTGTLRSCGFEFTSRLKASTDIQDVVEGATFVVLATPSSAIRATMASLLNVATRPRCVSVAKGIDPETLETHGDLAAALGLFPFCALTGPSFAREILASQPTALVAASADREFAQEIQAAFSGPRLRVYESDDLKGAEIGGALKNVIAIAAGMLEGLGLGENTRAALITRGLAEIARVVAAAGGRAETVSGLAGLGDLVLTCSSAQSRNHEFGRRVGLGQQVTEASSGLGTVEGPRTASAACRLGDKLGVETPIAQEVRSVLEGRVSPKDAVESLMLRRLKREVH